MNIEEVPHDILGRAFEFFDTPGCFRQTLVCTHFAETVYYTTHKIVISDLADCPSFVACLARLNFINVLEVSRAGLTDDDLQKFLPKSKPFLTRLILRSCPKLREVLVDSSYAKLRFVEISSCRFLMDVSFGSSQLLSVRHLDLSRTPVHNAGAIMSSVPKVRSVSFRGCGNIHSQFQFPSSSSPVIFQKLRVLDLSYTKIFPEILCDRILPSVPLLRLLIVSFCDSLRNLELSHPTLEELELANCKGLQNFRIVSCPKLRSIGLSKNSLYESKIQDVLIRTSRSIEEADFSECYHLHRLAFPKETLLLKLTSLNLQYTMTDDETVERVVNISPALEVLKLRQTEVRRCVVSSSSLRELDVSTTYVRNATIEAFLHRCPSLHTLSLGGCFSVSPGLKLASASIRVLRLHGTKISDGTVSFALRNCPALQGLDVSRCDLILTPEIENALALTRLDVSDCINMASITVQNCPNLAAMAFSRCIQLRDWKFGALGALQTVSVEKCFERLPLELLEKHPKLEVIGMQATAERSVTFQEVNFMQVVQFQKTGVWMRGRDMGFAMYDSDSEEEEGKGDPEEGKKKDGRSLGSCPPGAPADADDGGEKKPPPASSSESEK